MSSTGTGHNLKCTYHNEFNGDGEAALVLDSLVDLHLDDVENDDADQRDNQLGDVRIGDVDNDGAIRLQKQDDLTDFSRFRPRYRPT